MQGRALEVTRVLQMGAHHIPQSPLDCPWTYVAVRLELNSTVMMELQDINTWTTSVHNTILCHTVRELRP